MSTLPVVLDTDIGDDIDDALALALILNSREFDLRGITTVFRNAPRRAVLADHLLQTWKQSEIPVCAGASKPLLQKFDPQLGSQFEILEEDTLEEPTDHAVDFLLDAAFENESDKPLVIVAIGPLTNIALAIAKEPELVSAARLVLMGGMWNESAPDYRAEWNIQCDPEAAAMVFESGMEIATVGLDVTLQCRLEKSHLDQIAAHPSPQVGVLTRLLELWLRDNPRDPILHDPLAVLALLGDCVTFEEKRIEVQLCGETRGQTRVLPGEPNARVAVGVDAPRAVELFMERILAL